MIPQTFFPNLIEETPMQWNPSQEIFYIKPVYKPDQIKQIKEKIKNIEFNEENLKRVLDESEFEFLAKNFDDFING